MQLWISRQSTSEPCSRNRLNAVTKLSRMNAGQKNSSLNPKKSAKAAICDDATLLTRYVCSWCGVNFKISLSAKRTSIFWPERAGVDKIRLADLLKIHIDVELDPQVGKSFCKRETASFCLRLTPILQDKKQKHDQNQNILLWNRCYFGLSRKVMNATFCHSSCQCSVMLWWTLLSLTPIRCCHCWRN